MTYWHSDIVRTMAREGSWRPALIENLSEVSERLTFDRDGVRVGVLIQECDTRKGDYVAQVIHADDEDTAAGFYRRDSYDETDTALLGLLATWLLSPEDRG